MTEPDCVGNKFWFEEGFEKNKKTENKKIKSEKQTKKIKIAF